MKNPQPAQFCPLCQQENHCTQIESRSEHCWCFAPEIPFTEALLKKIPNDKRGTACICKNCASQDGTKRSCD